MNIMEILGKVGSGVITSLVPGGAAIVSAVNAFLPDDKKLPGSATGAQVSAAVSALPPEQRAQVIAKEFDVDITQIKESNDTLRTMLTAEQASTHTTRPRIALGSFYVVGFAIVAVVLLWCYAVATGNSVMVSAIMEGWPFLLAVLGPLVVLLRAYFGVLKTEQKNRLDAANGSTGTAVSGILSKLIR